MTWRNGGGWNKEFVTWMSTSPYNKAYYEDRVKPTYTKDFFQWSLAEEAFLEGARRMRKSIKDSLNKEEVLKQYLQWVDDVSDALENKTQFTPEEIVYKVCEIIEKDAGVCPNN